MKKAIIAFVMSVFVLSFVSCCKKEIVQDKADSKKAESEVKV